GRSSGNAMGGSEGHQATIRVLIADDHPVVRRGLRTMLGVEDHIQVVGEASNGREAVEQAAVLRPDIVLMDLQMPELDGISAIRVIRERVPATYVLVLTSFTTEGYVRPAIEAGAAGYLLKDATRTQVVHAIEAAARGQAPLDPVVARQVMAW